MMNSSDSQNHFTIIIVACSGLLILAVILGILALRTHRQERAEQQLIEAARAEEARLEQESIEKMRAEREALFRAQRESAEHDAHQRAARRAMEQLDPRGRQIPMGVAHQMRTEQSRRELEARHQERLQRLRDQMNRPRESDAEMIRRARENISR